MNHAAVVIGVALLPIIASAYVLFNLLTEGPFDWHYEQPGVAAGAIEIGVLYGLLLLAWRWMPRYAMAASVLLAWLYLRRHHVDAPALVGIVYLEGIIALGGLFLARQTKGDAGFHRFVPAHLAWFLAGLCVLVLLMVAVSALGYGQPIHLLALAAVILLPALALRWRQGLIVSALHSLKQVPREYGWLVAAVAVWLLVLIVRTNNADGHDSLWYPLRPEHMLIGARSFFDDLGLVHPVHYTPKGWELLIAPLSVFGDFSFMQAMTVFTLPLVLMALAAILHERGTPWFACGLALLVAVTVPAVANTALEAKADVLAALFTSLSVLIVMRMVRLRSRAGWPWLLVVSILAMGFRINVVPFLAVLVVGAGIWLACARSMRADSVDRAGLLCLIVATLTVLALTLRTWWLSGYPTISPGQLTLLWHWLGFDLRSHVGEMTWMFPQRWHEVPGLIVDWLFRPTRMEHIIVSWTGNIWLVCLLVAVIARKRMPAADGIAPAWPMWLLVLTGVALAVAIRYHSRGGDGNYFMPAVALALAWSVAAAWQSLQSTSQRCALTIGLVVASLFQASYSFVSAAWSEPGTRNADMDFTRSVIDTPQKRHGRLASAGLDRIGAFLESQEMVKHGLGFVTDDTAFWLPARYESLPLFVYTRRELIQDPAFLKQYLTRYSIDFLLLPVADGQIVWEKVYPEIRELLRAEYQACARVEDRAAVLVDLERCR